MLAGSLFIAAALLGQAECLFGIRAAADATAPQASTPCTAQTAPITPAPFRPWTNSSSAVNSATPVPATTQDPDYDRASVCSVSQRAWKSAYESWQHEHYTVRQSILPTYTTLFHFIPQPSPSRGALNQCRTPQYYCEVTNLVNVTEVRPQYAAEEAAEHKEHPEYIYDYPVPRPECIISQYECNLLWDHYEQNSTGKAKPDCRTSPYLVCNPAYVQPGASQLSIPTYHWIVPTQTATATGRSPAVIPDDKWSPTTEIPQPVPQQPHTQKPPHRAPITTVITVKTVTIIATIYPASSNRAATFPPSAVISGTTLVLGASPVTIGGATLSVAPPDGALVTVSASSVVPMHDNVPVTAPSSPVATKVVVLAGNTYTATASGSVLVFSPGLTATVGGPIITLPHSAPAPTGSGENSISDNTIQGGPSDSQVTASSQASSMPDDQDVAVSLGSDGNVTVMGTSTIVPAPTATDGTEAQQPEPTDPLGNADGTPSPTATSPQDGTDAASSVLIFLSYPATFGNTGILPTNGPPSLATPTGSPVVKGASSVTEAASPTSLSQGSADVQGQVPGKQSGSTTLPVPVFGAAFISALMALVTFRLFL